MKNWSRYTMFAVTMLTVLALSAMQVVPVLADDGAPPPTETPAVVDPPADGAVTPAEENSAPEAAPAEPPTTEVAEVAPEAAPAVTEAPAVEAPAVEEVAPTEQAPLATEVPAEAAATAPAEAAPAEMKEPAAEPETPAEILAQVPAGTDLVVLDENGEALPLVTEEAAEIVYNGDPKWCPVGAVPTAVTCSPSFTSFNDPDGAGPQTGLIQWLLANPKVVAGVIWVESGYSSALEGGAITLDGSAMPTIPGGTTSIANFALTIKGGWTGTGTTINPNTPSTFGVPLNVTNWKGDITLSDIVITGASGSGYALNVQTTKNVTLTNVDVQDNSTTNGGAYLNNTGGVGNVTINDSTFNGNSGTTGLAGGLIVRSSGNVTAKNLSAYNNGAAGVDIDTHTATTAKTVTMTGSNNFSYNSGDGLSVYSKGAITLSNINAVYNTGQGAILDNCNYNSGTQLCSHTFSAAVTLKGSGNFSGNGSDGLIVSSGGIITAANLTANNNGSDTQNGYGAYFSNYGVSLGKAITLTGVNVFNNNTGVGLWLDSKGVTTLYNLTANDNGSGTSCPAGNCQGLRVVSSASLLLNGYGTFNNNGEDGAKLDVWGLATLNNLTAIGNGASGVDLFNSSTLATEAVNLLGTNIFEENVGTGLSIESEGAVTLNNITANSNNAGVTVYNSIRQVYSTSLGWIDVLAGKNVMLKGVNTFNGNVDIGLYVYSSGIITTAGITAEDNDGDGVYLDNCLVDATDPDNPVCDGLAGKAVTMTGNNNLSNNLGNGLVVESLGVITVSNLIANDNAGSGVILDNDWARAVGGVTISGFSRTSWNAVSGLDIYSRGSVLASNLTASNNGPVSAAADEQFYRGVTIGASGNVTLLGVNTFNGNWNTGLQIGSNGIVILNNVNANNNGMAEDPTTNPTPQGYGVYVNNSTASIAKAVTLNGINVFNGNFDDGLYINTRGAVIVSKPTANQNGDRGAYINNQNASNVVIAPVTITGYGTFNSNGAGLEILSNGNVTLNNITASFNDSGDGVFVDAQRFTRGDLLDSALPVNVTLLGVNVFNGNSAGNGLTVLADGIITLTSVTANENAGDGANLNNTTYLKTANPRNIILNGWSTFIGNTGDGLEFHASGAVTLTRITSNYNTGTGVLGTAGSTITWTCGSLNLNNGRGYNLTAGAGKVVTLKGVFSYGNTLANSATPILVFTRTCPLP